MKTRVVYLLHLDKPIGNLADPQGWAGHYIGSAWDLGARLAQERSVQCDVRILQEARRLGIEWQLARTWPGDRKEERRIKNRGGASRLCPLCGIVPRDAWMRGDIMIGGYAAVAGELNKRYAPQPPIDRRQVYQWDRRQTRNAAGELPPAPVEERPDAKRSTPTRVFEVEAWVPWFAAGTPGPRRAGWRRYVEIDQPEVSPEFRAQTAELMDANDGLLSRLAE